MPRRYVKNQNKFFATLRPLLFSFAICVFLEPVFGRLNRQFLSDLFAKQGKKRRNDLFISSIFNEFWQIKHQNEIVSSYWIQVLISPQKSPHTINHTLLGGGEFARGLFLARISLSRGGAGCFVARLPGRQKKSPFGAFGGLLQQKRRGNTVFCRSIAP